MNGWNPKLQISSSSRTLDLLAPSSSSSCSSSALHPPSKASSHITKSPHHLQVVHQSCMSICNPKSEQSQPNITKTEPKPSRAIARKETRDSALNRLVLLSSSHLLSVSLLGTEDLLVSVLLLLSLLSGGLLHLLGQTVSNQSVSRLELLGVSSRLVNQTETGRLATTELGSETKHGDSILVGLVQLGQSLSQLVLGDVGSVRVQDVDDELLSGQQGVGNDLSGSDRNGVTLRLVKQRDGAVCGEETSLSEPTKIHDELASYQACV